MLSQVAFLKKFLGKIKFLIKTRIRLLIKVRRFEGFALFAQRCVLAHVGPEQGSLVVSRAVPASAAVRSQTGVETLPS
jgi:hypothetical protein